IRSCMGTVPKWKEWLQDPDILRWHGKLALGSPSTATERLRLLARYCRATGTTPADLARRVTAGDAERRRVESDLQDFVIKMRGTHKPSDHAEDDADPTARERCLRGHSPGYTICFVKAIRSWADHSGAPLRRIAVGGN